MTDPAMPEDNEAAEIAVARVHKLLADQGRGCGTCKACCTVMAVDMQPVNETTKPERQKCSFLCNAGCKIYDKKPKSCSSFICMWLASEITPTRMSAAWRPDRVGAVIDVNETGIPVAHLVHENRWTRDGPLRDLLLYVARGVSDFAGQGFIILDRPSGQHLVFDAFGRTHKLIPVGIGPTGLPLYRTEVALLE